MTFQSLFDFLEKPIIRKPLTVKKRLVNKQYKMRSFPNSILYLWGISTFSYFLQIPKDVSLYVRTL